MAEVKNQTGVGPQEEEIAGQEPTQEPNPNPQDKVTELAQRMEQLEKQLSDKDRFITELQENNRTLEARINQVSVPNEENITPKSVSGLSGVSDDSDLTSTTAEILEEAQIDPQKAGEKLAKVIRGYVAKTQEETIRNLEPLIDRQSYVKEVKAKNQDLIDLGLEPAITIRTNQLLQSGKDFKSAIDIAVKEAREKIEKLKTGSSSIPASAVGERGSNQEPPAPKPEKAPTAEDEIAAERARKMKMGL